VKWVRNRNGQDAAEPCPSSALARGPRHIAVVVLSLLLTAILSLELVDPAVTLAAPLPRAVGDPVTLLVNSSDNVTAAQGGDSNPGDGACVAADGSTVTLTDADGNSESVPRCTLRTALTEANTLGWTADVTIALDPRWAGGTISTTGTTSTWMSTVAPDEWTTGAVFVIAAPMTIDLDDRLGVTPATDHSAATFWITDTTTANIAPSGHTTVNNVTLKGFSNIFSGETSFTVDWSATGVTFDGGMDADCLDDANGDGYPDYACANLGSSTIQTANHYTEHFFIINNGASDVTIKNYRMGGFYWEDDSYGGGAILLNDRGRALTTTNVTIDNVDFTSPQTGTECSGSDGRGCVNNAVVVFDGRVNGLTMTNCAVTNLTDRGGDHYILSTYYAASAANITVTDNLFTKNFVGTGWEYSLIIGVIYYPWGGTNLIARNRFDNSGVAGQGNAIGMYSSRSTLTTRDDPTLTIADNYFDGFAVDGVMLYYAGIVTMRRNTFGPHSASQTSATRANLASEEYATSSLLVANLDIYTNNAIRTWVPSVSAVGTNDITASQVGQVAVKGCVAPLQVEAPTTTTYPTPLPYADVIPTLPVIIDVYWTALNDAEVFVGSFGGESGFTASPQLLDVTVPLEAIDPTTGAVSGYLRLQTHSIVTVEDPSNPGTMIQAQQSSQYSRVAQLTGTCQPEIDIRQTQTYGDSEVAEGSTLTRLVAFDVAATTPVDDVAAAQFTVTGSAANARIASVTRIDDRTFTVVALADDSGTIEVALPAGATTMSGTTIVSAASTTGPTPDINNLVTFTNPLTATTALTLLTDLTVEGAAAGAATATVAIDPAAPVPLNDVTVALVVPETLAGVTVAPATDVIAAGERSGEGVVLAAPTLPDQATGTIARTVTSEDPQYDGLLLPGLDVTVLTVDPSLAVVKRAWTDVAPGTTADDLLAPGHAGATELAADTDSGALPRLDEGAIVTWTYTVTYTEAGTSADHLTAAGRGLTGVEVSDDRLGVVCTGLVLLPGQSVSCLAEGPISVTGSSSSSGATAGGPSGEETP
jgi:adhesin/invasin